MSKMKWLMLIALGMAVCVTIVAIAVILWFMGVGDNIGVDRSLPVYTIDQVASAHPGTCTPPRRPGPTSM